MSSIKSEAVVLSTSDYSETTKLVSLLTRTLGRVRLMAKGVRGPKSKNRGMVEPLSHVEAQFTLRDPEKLGLLIESRVINPAEYLRADLLKYALASTLAELLERSAQGGEGNEHLFELLAQYLAELRDEPKPEQRTVKTLGALLAALGVQPDAQQCVSCGNAGEAKAFSVRLGGIICANCGKKKIAEDMQPFNPGQQKALGLIVGGDEKKIAQLKLTPDQTRYLLRLLLNLAQHHLDVKLNSRKFLEGLLI